MFFIAKVRREIVGVFNNITNDFDRQQRQRQRHQPTELKADFDTYTHS